MRDQGSGGGRVWRGVRGGTLVGGDVRFVEVLLDDSLFDDAASASGDGGLIRATPAAGSTGRPFQSMTAAGPRLLAKTFCLLGLRVVSLHPSRIGGSRMSATLPKVQAIVLADQIYTDRETGKKIIAGTFNRLWAQEFPSHFSRPSYCYLNLTNIRGECDIVVKWVDLDDGGVLLQSPTITIASDDPLANGEIVAEVPPFPLPHAGTYCFEVHADESRIGEIRVKVDRAEQPPSSGDQE